MAVIGYISNYFHFQMQEEFIKDGNPCNVTPEEYFDSSIDISSKDIGRPKELNTKVQKFKVCKSIS